MSCSYYSNTHIFVEYKDAKDSKWHLLKTYVPLEERIYDRDKPISELDEITLKLGNSRFYKSYSIVMPGLIRDLLNDQTKSFYGRGFPNDLSEDLTDILQKEQTEIDILNEKDPSMNHEWRYSKSWCALSELRETIDKSYEKAMMSYIENKFSHEFERMNENLEKIYNYLNPQPKKTEKMEECVSDSSDYFDELKDLVFARGFCEHIYMLLTFIVGGGYGYLDEINEIRLIYYTKN